MADVGGNGTNMTVIALAVVAVSLMMAISGYAIVLMIEKFDADQQEYKKSWYYTTSGTHIVGSLTYEFEGDGESQYVSETDGFRTYIFTFRQTDPSGPFTVKAKLICDDDGRPTEIFSYDGKEGNTSFWTYNESGVGYRFGINEGRVISVDVTSEGLSLKAVII